MKILNFGSLNIDYTYSVNHFVKEGETISSSSLDIFSGGKGLNQSVALSKSGLKVWHAGAVGKSDGKILISELEEYDVNTSFIERLDCKSGHAVIQKDISGDNCIILHGGANLNISKEWIDNVISNFGSGDYLILQNEIIHLDYIVEEAHKKGMKIILNPSPMNESILKLNPLFIDYIILNKIEAEQLCGEVDITTDDVLIKLRDKYKNATFILTLGGDGSVFYSGDEKIVQKSFPVNVVDTTAAGDTFTGYFFGSLLKGKSITQSLEVSSKAAAIAVTRNGAVPSIPTLQEVLDFK